MSDSYVEEAKRAWEAFQAGQRNKPLPNIMLLGKTGCGKSSLINLVFGKKVAAVSDTSRGTEGFVTYRRRDYDFGINLTDSRGYEMANGGGEKFENYRDAIIQKLQENRTKKPLEKIHIIWYCIDIAGRRIQDYDLEILRILLGEKDVKDRVAVVFTKCDEDDANGGCAAEFRRIIVENFGGGLATFAVSNKPSVESELGRLIEHSVSQVREGELSQDLREAFVAEQMVDLEAKREVADAKIKYYAGPAFLAGFIPTPIADAAILAGLQAKMCAAIAEVYRLDKFAGISKTLLIDLLATGLGKALAKGLLKLIPGAGQVVGVVNGTVAGAITAALGKGVSVICYEACKKIAKGEKVDFEVLFEMENLLKHAQKFWNK